MNKCIKYIGALFMEKNDNREWVISIGRTSFWMAFIPALYVWIDSMGTEDIASGHLSILIALTTYNLSKKAVSKVGDIFKKNAQSKNLEDGPG
jgi:hypothetical protein